MESGVFCFERRKSHAVSYPIRAIAPSHPPYCSALSIPLAFRTTPRNLLRLRILRRVYCARTSSARRPKLSFFCFLSISDIFLWISRLDSGFQPLFLRRNPVFSQIDLKKISFSGLLPEKDISLAERQKRTIFFARISKKGYFRQKNRNFCEGAGR